MSLKTKRFCLLCSYMIMMLLLCLNAFSQYNFTDIENLFKQNQKELGKNFAMAIFKDGKIIYQKQTTDFTAKAQAPIFNAGNWMTAALVMTFVDEGKISLEDNVSKYIPMFEKYMKNYITIRNCLTNTTGIHADAGVGKFFDKSKHESLEDDVNSYAKKEIQANPGTEFYYSDMGPSIAARVLEVISKKSFDRLMQERILRPLKMRGTSFANDAGGAINPSGGAHSTVLDYVNFLSMLLNKGMFEGKRILTEKAVNEIETAQFTQLPVKYTPKITEGLHYGLGTWIEDMNGDGSGTVMTCYDFLGVYPVLDKCRNYVAVLIVEKPREDLKKEFYTRFREAIDSQISSNCKE
ncbi:MAG TPA: serine hydrolase [Puia sp.]|nr:serine hydrolase [Puia sp.]